MKSASRHALRAALACALASASLAPAYAFTASVDSISITKNGGAFFTDTFSDGIAPPSAPNFSNGATASYILTGAPGIETGGKYVLDTATGSNTAYADGTSRKASNIWLASNNDPADTVRGLKPNHTFTYQGLFDLASVPNPNSGYGISFRDSFFDQGTLSIVGQTLSIGVGRNAGGNLGIGMSGQDFTANTRTFIAGTTVDLSYDQILLQLDRPTTANNSVTGSYQYWSGGAPATGFFTLGTGTIFNAQQWTRAEVYASESFAAPVPEPSVYALFGAGLLTIAWRRRARRV